MQKVYKNISASSKTKKEDKLVWIAAVDNDSFNYAPDKVSKKDAEKACLQHYPTQKKASDACNHLNSL